MRVLTDPVLAETARGRVAICPCCGLPAVAFDGTRVTVRPAPLRRLLATVRQVRDQAERPGACWTWGLRARTDREDVTFQLTGDDAAELADLLGAAVAALDLDATLADVLAAAP